MNCMSDLCGKHQINLQIPLVSQRYQVTPGSPRAGANPGPPEQALGRSTGSLVNRTWLTGPETNRVFHHLI